METTATRRARKLVLKFPGSEYTFLDVDLTITRAGDEFTVDITYVPELSLGVEKKEGCLKVA